jgi:hypothetical protein
MATGSSKAGRTQNFTAIEKTLLGELVEQHRDVLENKRTDNATCKVCVHCSDYCNNIA